MIRLLISVAALVFALPVTAGETTGKLNVIDGEKVEIEEIEFFGTLNDGQGKEVFYESRLVPLIPYRSCYGWRLRVAEGKGLIKFKEIFKLPKEPKYWGGENDEYATSKITEARRTSITERFATIKDGWIRNSWCVAPGDPEGEYSMDVYINGLFVKRFDFQVRKIKPN